MLSPDAVELIQSIEYQRFGTIVPDQDCYDICEDSTLNHVVEKGPDWILVWSHGDQVVRCLYAGKMNDAEPSGLDDALARMFDFMDANSQPLSCLCNEHFSVPLTAKWCKLRGYTMTTEHVESDPHPVAGGTFSVFCLKVA